MQDGKTTADKRRGAREESAETAHSTPAVHGGTTLGQEAGPAREATPDSGDWVVREPSPVPRAVGDYRILRRLGTGGMGDVLLAWDETLSRRVALKRIRPDRMREPELRRRFEIEARLTALLQHPSIIPVYHYSGQLDGAFYTMRPVEGFTLGELIGRLREDDDGAVREEWPTGRLVRLFLQAANAVAYAHSRGVMHRDLKPANIMIGPFEEVLVLDWGMAKYAGEDEGEQELDRLERLRTETASKTLVGTPAYMAPEQLRNEPTDFRAEVFALGIILYELLALRLPWRGRNIADLLDAMTSPPADPGAVQPGRTIPPSLGEVVQRALDPDPGRRFPTVRAFSAAVSYALEGRAPWKVREDGSAEHWRLADGRMRTEGSSVHLRSRGQHRPFRYFCLHKFSGNVRVAFDLRVRGGTDLQVWVNATLNDERRPMRGYCLEVAPGRRRTLSLQRSGRVVAGATSPSLTPRAWTRIVATRENDQVSLRLDGVEVYSYRDPIPLHGGTVGVQGRSIGAEVRNLRVYTRGSDARVSCLAVPDAFFNRGLYEEARSEYESIAASHPGRHEGRLAQHRAGLCMVEMARRESDGELRTLLLREARDLFSDPESQNTSCLSGLGRAVVAVEEEELGEAKSALAEALSTYPGDPLRPAVREWLLGRLHSLDSDRRLEVAELLPLAIRYCMEGWGKRVVREVMHRVRSDWETPSFLVGRSRFREGDPTSRLEAALFFAFWVGRSAEVAEVVRELLAEDLLRTHHVSDAAFSLLELGDAPAARDLLDEVEESWGVIDERRGWILTLCRAAVVARCGDPRAGREMLRDIRPRPGDRPSNSARLFVARSLFEIEGSSGVRRVLRRGGARDAFAREHLAWFALMERDARTAERELRPLVERGDHLRGRNLTNLLHGCRLLLERREDEAQRVFAALKPYPWPRTWTLGSHYAVRRLGRGSVERYLEGAFPWERRILNSHRTLLARVTE